MNLAQRLENLCLVTNGREALEAFKGETQELVLTDGTGPSGELAVALAYLTDGSVFVLSGRLAEADNGPFAVTKAFDDFNEAFEEFVLFSQLRLERRLEEEVIILYEGFGLALIKACGGKEEMFELLHKTGPQAGAEA